MSRPYRPYDPDQLYLMPPSVRDWVPQGDLSHFISETVEELDLSDWKAKYRFDGKGNVPYDPRMMLKVLIYAYSMGIFSSRKIAQALERDIAFRMLGSGNFPDFRTINRFRLQNRESFSRLFVQVVHVAQEAGLVKLGTVAVDGTKLKANASKRKAMSYGRMQEEERRLESEISTLLEEAKKIDEQEDKLYGEDKRGDELPEELQRREGRLEKIREAKKRVEARQREEDKAAGRKEDDQKPGDPPKGGGSKGSQRKFGEPKDKKQDNFTDPESRIMKTSSQGFQQCYNAQTVVDEQEQIIVAADVGNAATDYEYLVPMVDQAKANTGRTPKKVLADAGYKSEKNFEEIEKRKITAYISLGREGKNGQKSINPELKLTRGMQKRLERERGKKLYRKRKGIVEPPFGWIKHVLGFQRFSVRGIEKVKAEWSLVCLAMNLKRMNNKMEWKSA